MKMLPKINFIHFGGKWILAIILVGMILPFLIWIFTGRFIWPLFEYEYNGMTIQYVSEFLGNNSGYDTGDIETLYINPAEPDKAYEPYNKVNLRNAFLMIGAGLLCLIFFITSLFEKTKMYHDIR